MHFIEPLSREERLRRIALILIKAGTLYRRAVAAGQMPVPPELQEREVPPAADAESTDDRSRILNYLRRRGAAAPKDIRLALGLSRATAQRRLAELARDRLIAATGTTQSLVYQLLAPIHPFANPEAASAVAPVEQRTEPIHRELAS
jgi:hypothetical protein